MSLPTSNAPSATKRLTFVLALSLMAAMCAALIGYRLALSYAYVQFSRADLVPPEDLASQVATASADAEIVQRGEHLIKLIGCADCHGQNLAGQTLIDTPAVRISAPNLTDPVRQKDVKRSYAALRLGLDEEHRALWLMPRQALIGLAHSDLVALLAALAHQKPLSHELPVNRLSGQGYRALLTKGLTLVDKTVPAPSPEGWEQRPPKVDGIEAGAYLLRAGRCTSCHTSNSTKSAPAGGQVGLATQGHDLTIELSAPELLTPALADALYSQLKQDPRLMPLVQRLKQGRCPDDKTEQERGRPSRMAEWSDDEAASALAAWRVWLALESCGACSPLAGR